MIRQKRWRFSVFVLIVIAVWLMVYSLFMPDRTMETIRSALDIFVRSVLPPLAVFSVCSKLLVKTKAIENFIPVKMSCFLDVLGMSSGGLSAFLVGFIAGFPTGAAMISDLCGKGEISEDEAASLLPFCNHASAAFLFGTVGKSMLNDSSMGFIFFFAQTVTAWVCVCMTAHERIDKRLPMRSNDTSHVSFVSAFTTSIRESAFSMVNVCGFVVFFSLAGTVLFDTLFACGSLTDPSFFALIGGVLEISFGFRWLSEGFFSPKALLILGGILLGFGGISVFMQAIERTEAFFFSPGKYFEGKLLESVICPMFCMFFFFLYQRKNGKSLIVVCSVLIFCGFYFLNYIKIKFFSKKCGKIERNAV